MKIGLLFYVFFLDLFWNSRAKKRSEDTKSKNGSPNIILFFADDLGYGDLGFMGHPTSRTPTIDELAGKGKVFTHFYVPSPFCSPSRASLLTGRYPVRSGTYPIVYGPENPLGLPRNETTIAKLLKQKGYRTQIVGKWHLGVGYQKEYLPSNLAYGFDNFLGLPQTQDLCPCPICFLNNGSCMEPCYEDGYVSCPLFNDIKIIEQPVSLPNLTARFVERAVNFVKEASNAGKPFFLYFSFLQIHTPHFACTTFPTKNPRGTIGDALLEMDATVRALVELLKKMKILKDTLIWFTSDNGPSLENHQKGGSAGLLRCGKGTTWEGGVRVPSIVYWKDKIDPGRTNDLTSSLDILPTIANIVGLDTNHITLDGVDISRSLFQQNEKSAREFFAVYPGEPSIEIGPLAVIYKQYKAHFYTRGSEFSDNNSIDLLCRGSHPLTKHDPPLLYNLYSDPGERYTLNRTDENDAIIALITKWRNQHMQTMTWMAPRTTVNDLRSAQSCCSDIKCEPFPQCCDCPESI